MEDYEVSIYTPTEKLDKDSKEIVDKIVREEDSDKLKNLISLFNTNQSKKSVVRADIYSRLLDKISVQMEERIEKRPGEFSNKELVEYMSAIRTAMEKGNIDTESVKLIQNNNTQINVKVDTMSRESKDKVADAVKAILAKMNKQGIDNDYVEVNDD